jgi:hypothetical protein
LALTAVTAWKFFKSLKNIRQIFNARRIAVNPPFLVSLGVIDLSSNGHAKGQRETRWPFVGYRLGSDTS